MTNYNLNEPLIVQNWWIRRYVRLPERKSKEAIMLEILFTVGPLVMISYIILQNTGLSVGDNTTYNISSQLDNAILKTQGNQWYWDYEFIIKKVNKSNGTQVLVWIVQVQILLLNIKIWIFYLLKRIQLLLLFLVLSFSILIRIQGLK